MDMHSGEYLSTMDWHLEGESTIDWYAVCGTTQDDVEREIREACERRATTYRQPVRAHDATEVVSDRQSFVDFCLEDALRDHRKHAQDAYNANQCLNCGLTIVNALYCNAACRDKHRQALNRIYDEDAARGWTRD